MPRLEVLMAGPLGWSVVNAPASNNAALSTKAAAAGLQHIISGVSFSSNGIPAAAVLVTLKDGVTVLDQWYVPASLFAPIVIEFKRPFVITAGALTEINLPALGAGVSGSVTLRGITVAA